MRRGRARGGIDGTGLIFDLCGLRKQAVVGASASAAQALPVRVSTKPYDVVQVAATQDCFLAFGGNSVVALADATSLLVLRGEKILLVPIDPNGAPYTHFSVIRVGSDGIFQIEGVIT